MSRRLAAAAILAVGLLAGCDDEGPSVFAPQHDIAGVWVRYDPRPPMAADIVLPYPLDTLFLYREGWGRWSRDGRGDLQTPARTLADVSLEDAGLLLHLNIAPCATCLSSVVPGPHYELARTGEHTFVLRNVMGLDEGRMYYRRVPYDGPILE